MRPWRHARWCALLATWHLPCSTLGRGTLTAGPVPHCCVFFGALYSCVLYCWHANIMNRRVFKPPAPTVDVETFKQAVEKRAIACIKSIINGGYRRDNRKRQRVANGNADSAASGTCSGDESDGCSSSSANQQDGGAAELAAIRARLAAQQLEAKCGKEQERQQLLVRQADAAKQLAEAEARLSAVQEDRARLMQQIKQVCARRWVLAWRMGTLHERAACMRMQMRADGSPPMHKRPPLAYGVHAAHRR